MKGKKWIKYSAFALLGALALAVFIWRDLVLYGFRQGKGQLHIIWNARPVETFMADPNFPDSLKQKLLLIDAVRRYAIDSLGLKDTENYKTLFDQQGEEILWVVTACEPYRLQPKVWSFPIIGSLPYKGFFEREAAKKLQDELKGEGWDVNVRNPGAWSTLGWFTDPILSKMLEREEGDLASLIIHEMAHATIFVKDSVDFNENLASFIGDRGAEHFLSQRYGKGSPEYLTYVHDDHDYVKYVQHFLCGAKTLDSLYRAIEGKDLAEKQSMKKETIEKIVASLDTLTLFSGRDPSLRFKEALPNNAYFMAFIHYQSQQDVFFEAWTKKFNGDLKAYIAYLQSKYPSF